MLFQTDDKIQIELSAISTGTDISKLVTFPICFSDTKYRISFGDGQGCCMGITEKNKESFGFVSLLTKIDYYPAPFDFIIIGNQTDGRIQQSGWDVVSGDINFPIQFNDVPKNIKTSVYQGGASVTFLCSYITSRSSTSFTCKLIYFNGSSDVGTAGEHIEWCASEKQVIRNLCYISNAETVTISSVDSMVICCRSADVYVQ